MLHFEDRPLLAIWETTQACDLACQHCRASAKAHRDPAELSTTEGKKLLSDLAAENVRLVVLTGGDPAKRPDLVELVRHGASLGLTMGLTPSATPLITRELIFQLADAGLSRLAISIDGPDAILHDSFRGVEGAFERSLAILRTAKEAGISLQVNTSVHSKNIARVFEMTPLLKDLRIKLWSLFVVIATGRAGRSMTLSAERVETLLTELADVSEHVPFAVKTTAAPMYRRILAQRKRTASHGNYGRESLRVNEGRGFLFVSHRGEVMPSGFLPLPCGNVRDGKTALALYRESPLFVELRAVDHLNGKCGVCEFRKLCGGSRARAYAETGNPLASDPACAYNPPGYVPTASPVHLPMLG